MGININIFTRCYVKSNGEWDLGEKLINSMVSKLNSLKRLRWIILVSNTKELKSNCIEELKSKFSDNLLVIPYSERLSCGQAREYLYNWLCRLMPYIVNPDKDYYINVDADDELINLDKLNELSKFDFNEDLIGYGLITDKPSDKFTDEYYDNGIHNQWYFDEDYFKRARRNVINETQSMFLFIHSGSFIKSLMEHRKYFVTYPYDHKDEPCEDTLVTLDVANMIKEGYTVDISAINLNLLKYTIRGDSISNNTSRYQRLMIKNILTELGYLKVNRNLYYLGKNNQLYKYNFNE